MQASVQQTHKRRWSAPIREKITDISKGISEILAGLAEPFMRYSTIYLALATSITVINYAPIYDLTKGIVIASPEFVLLGAFSIAETAIANGQKKWGKTLLIICALLAIIMVTTFVDIFIVSFSPIAINILNFSRCVVAIGFSFVLGKLDDDQTGATSQAQNNGPIAVAPAPVIATPVPPAGATTTPTQSGPGATPTTLVQNGSGATITPTEASNPAPVEPEHETTQSEPAAPTPELTARAKQSRKPAPGKTKARSTSRRQAEPTTDTRSQDEKLEDAYQQLTREQARVSGRTLALLAHVNRGYATKWLEARSGTTDQSQTETEPATLLDSEPEATGTEDQ